MRFLFLTTKYPFEAGDSYMTSELAGELIKRGHEVNVLHLNWGAPFGRATRLTKGIHGEKIVEVAPRAITTFGKLVLRTTKFLFSARHAGREMTTYLSVVDHDVTVTWTPAMTMEKPLRKAISLGVRHHILYVFDFFPLHHREIGMIPNGPVFWVAMRLEEWLYRKFTAIICNFPGNIKYLKKNYRLRNDQILLSTPLWSEISPPEIIGRDETRTKYDLPKERPIAIFGGQITDGRGIEQMLKAGEIAEQENSPLLFLFVGDGRLASLVREKAETCRNVAYLPNVKRDDYLSLVSACDVGMVATVEGVSSFSFPTKTIDYLRAGLPVVAAVEEGSDYLSLLNKYQVGSGVRFGDAIGFYKKAESLALGHDRPEELSSSINRCLEDVFHVRHAADTLLGAVKMRPENTEGN